MFKNYLLIAIRNIFRNKLFSTVNILGLAFGIGSALLIFLWVTDELEFDHFHSNVDRLYQIMENQRYSDGRIYTFTATPGPMAPFIKEKFPEIEKATRYTWDVNLLFQIDDKSFYEKGKYVDQDFIEMFSFPMLKGDVTTALKDKSSIVITEKMAAKYFGDGDPLGKDFLLSTKNSFKVTGVIKDPPKNSSIQFDYLLPFEFFFDENKRWIDQWGNNNISTFIMLRADANPVDFGNKLKHEIKEHNEGTNVELFLHPFKDIYLQSDFEDGKLAGGRVEYVRIFFIVAVFVLIIACINFMNLSTAQATKRAKEVGLRKVIGAVPTQLFRQFMGESFLTVTVSAAIAVLMAFLILPKFNDITSKDLSLSVVNIRTFVIFVGIIVFTAFVAGSYPAIFISEFKPVQVLKGQVKSGSRAGFFRKILVVVQFSLSILLIISTAVVFRQMNFMEDRDIGFDRDNVFYIYMEGDIHSKYETFRQRLLAESGIEAVTAASDLPISIGSSTMGLQWEGKDPNEEILFTNIDVDYEFIQTMKMEMVEGRPFDRSRITDTTGYIVNEKAAEKFGFKGGTADQDLTMWKRKGKIVGVVKDFNFGSLHTAVDPLVMRMSMNNVYLILVRTKPNETEAALRSAEKLHKEYAAGCPFRYTFLNDDWDGFYKPEAQRGKVFNTLAVLSIFISCLGLFGLSAFSAERRTKELGIRKALGASTGGLIQLMGREFTVLVLVASCIGCPAGWYLMTLWLKGYAYHVDVGIITLILAAVICLTVSLITIAYHSIRVAASDPVKSLRYE